MITPPLRWVGGKRRFAEDLAARCAARLEPGCHYIEPFMGSAAVALAMPPMTFMQLGDACTPVGYLFWWIKQEPEAVAEYAAGYGQALDQGWNTAEGFAAARLEHNREPWSATDWRPSARFLWMMHACFNGVYRENATGLFNVPWGKRKNIAIPKAEHLRSIADHLANTDVYPGCDFVDMYAAAGVGDVIFGDPPYDGDADAYVSYTAKRFGPAQQEKLAEVSDAAVARGATVIMTNADTPRIRSLYRGWTFEEIVEARPVAADPDRRTPAHCLIVTREGRR